MRDDNEFDIVVELGYEKATRGHRDRYGAPEEPDEPENVYVERAYTKDTGVGVELTGKEEERAIELGFAELESNRQDDFDGDCDDHYFEDR